MTQRDSEKGSDRGDSVHTDTLKSEKKGTESSGWGIGVLREQVKKQRWREGDP